MEKEGIITGYHASVDPMKLGYHILAFIHLDVIPADKPKFYAYAAEVPNVLECCCVTGEYSMLMKVAFQSTMELDMFIDQLQQEVYELRSRLMVLEKLSGVTTDISLWLVCGTQESDGGEGCRAMV